MIKSKYKEGYNLTWLNDEANPIKIGDKTKINLGCGNHRREGFFQVDLRDLPTVDLAQDLEQFPWPIETESASLVISRRLQSQIAPKSTLPFMDEVWRILEFGGAYVSQVVHADGNDKYVDPMTSSYWTEDTLKCFLPKVYDLYRVYTPRPWELEYLYIEPGKSHFNYIIRKIHMVGL